MSALVWAANVLGWPLIHVSVGSLAVRLPRSLFERENWITAPRSWERGGRVYRDLLAIRRWKAKLPDGAPWLGGNTKTQIFSNGKSSRAEFVIETRRAEIAHWAMLAFTPVFFLWNPPWASCVMLAYAIGANFPCILAQRYNRLTLAHARSMGKRSGVLV